jgi:hypothetical protein
MEVGGGLTVKYQSPGTAACPGLPGVQSEFCEAILPGRPSPWSKVSTSLSPLHEECISAPNLVVQEPPFGDNHNPTAAEVYLEARRGLIDCLRDASRGLGSLLALLALVE